MADHQSSTGDAPDSDAVLVDAANRGDAAAFEAIYLRHRDWAFRQALRLLADEHLALEVAQDAFVDLLRQFPGFVLRGQMRSYLYPVIRHAAIRAAQRNRRRIAVESSAAPIGQRDPSIPNDLRVLAAAMDLLDTGHREVIRLRFVEDFSLAEIAAATGLPLGTVKSRLHHALRQLRTDPRLEDFFADS